MAGNAASGVLQASVELPEGAVLSRKFNLDRNADGSISSHDDNMKKLVELGEGAVLQEFGIISTSTNPAVWSKRAQVKITCGPGVRGLYVAKNPGAKKDHGAISVNPSESEIILPVGTRFIIKKIHPEGHGFTDKTGSWGGPGMRVIEVVALPPA